MQRHDEATLYLRHVPTGLSLNLNNYIDEITRKGLIHEAGPSTERNELQTLARHINIIVIINIQTKNKCNRWTALELSAETTIGGGCLT